MKWLYNIPNTKTWKEDGTTGIQNILLRPVWVENNAEYTSGIVDLRITALEYIHEAQKQKTFEPDEIAFFNDLNEKLLDKDYLVVEEELDTDDQRYYLNRVSLYVQKPFNIEQLLNWVRLYFAINGYPCTEIEETDFDTFAFDVSPIMRVFSIDNVKRFESSWVTSGGKPNTSTSWTCNWLTNQWIGDIPEHWNLSKLKYYVKVNSGEGINTEEISDDALFPVYGGNGIMGYTNNFNSENEDIIIGRVGAKCGNIRLVADKKWISDNALILTVLKEVDLKYLSIVLDTMNLNRLANQNAQPLITGTLVKESHSVFPPLPEQTAIANFLDHKTAQIDNAIAKKQQLIELLEEERKAVINEAVNVLNYDSNDLMKTMINGAFNHSQSENQKNQSADKWQLKRLKYVFDLITTKTTDNLHKVGLENIKSKTGKYIETETDFEGEGIEFAINDILFGKLRPYLAKVYLADFAGSAVGDFFVLRCKDSILPAFAKFKLLDHWFIEISNSSTFGAKMPRVGWEFLANLEISIPPLSEQHLIITRIENLNQRIDNTIFQISQEIELLKEYRQSLIFEAVTGKIKIV